MKNSSPEKNLGNIFIITAITFFVIGLISAFITKSSDDVVCFSTISIVFLFIAALIFIDKAVQNTKKQKLKEYQPPQKVGVILIILAFTILFSAPIGKLIGVYTTKEVLASLMGGSFVLLGAAHLLEMDKKSPEENNASENKSPEEPAAPSTETKYQKYVYIGYPNCKKYQDIDPNGDHWTWDKDEEGIFVVSDWLEKLKNL